MDDKVVWYPCPRDGFALGQIVDLGADMFTVQPLSGGKMVNCPHDRIFMAEEQDKDVDDNCALMYLNEATLLNNVQKRYLKNKIYTYVANILVAANPYCDIKGLYSTPTIKSYNGKSLGTMPPHVFAIGDKAYRDMLHSKQSQSIIVSGESGAGKTESTKYLLRYLTESWGTNAGNMEDRIQQSNPLLEAFGNAKTVRNNNSSRFGKFVEIHFDGRAAVCGGYISHYLLEKSRVCVQGPEERNYHIFYQLCAGAPPDVQKGLRLLPPDQFRYLNKGCTQYFLGKNNTCDKTRMSQQMREKGPLHDILRDDVQDFKRTWSAMDHMGMNDNEKMCIFTVIAGILHLGNVSFSDDPTDAKGGCMVSKESFQPLANAATLLGLPQDDLKQALTSRVMQATRSGVKGTAIMVPLKVGEASSARDALAKSIYSKLFDHIVIRINQALPFTSSKNFIGILDIAGFEYFQNNSFEQFCINYCNEKLQQFFNQRILKEEQDLYEKEGLGVKKIDFSDNQDCIELIESRGSGIFDILDEENKLPRPSFDHFTSQVHSSNKSHYRLALPRKSKLKAHREVRDDQGFLIRHFAGGVVYQTEQFLEKNNDALHHNLAFLVNESSNDLVRSIYSPQNGNAPTAKTAGKLSFVSVGSKFRNQLGTLLEKLQGTGTSFIRCIKPNSKMADHLFEGSNVLSQLQCAGMHNVLDLMQQGYPSRTPFSELYNMYKRFLPPNLARLDPRLFSKALFKALGLNDYDFKFGMTKVFFRAGKFAEFDQMMKSDPENLAKLVEKVRTWLIRSRFKKAQYCAWQVIKLRKKIEWRRSMLIRIQKNVRMWIAVRKFRPRYKGIQKVRTLHVELVKMESIIGSLKKNKDSMKQKAAKLSQVINATIRKIQMNPMTREAIDREYSSLVAEINSQLSAVSKMVHDQKIKDEQERLRKVQEEMERERKKKEEEERLRKEEDDRKILRIEMENKRKQEEVARKIQEEKDRKMAEELEAKLSIENKSNESRRQALEQERRDRELALRLASEDQDQVEDVTLPAPSPFGDAPKKVGKHDLSKWKYAELRDTINTSCDMELLDACKEEFHRRLKVYHAWKLKNKKPDTPAEQRAPKDIVESSKAAVHMGMSAPKTPAAVKQQNIQRFFRIPFVKPSDRNHCGEYQKKGWWFAHFDGQWIARQLELHPDKIPVLLLAGVDDMQMCELSLDETGLTSKRGAEILAHEFENEWKLNGGMEYVNQHKSRVSSQYMQQLLGI